MSKRMVAKQNIYRTADGEIILREGDPRAAFHVAREGSEVPDEWVKAVRTALGDEPEETQPEPVEPEPVSEPTEPDEPTADAAVTEAPAPEPTPEPEPAKPAAKTVKKAAKKATSKAVKKQANK